MIVVIISITCSFVALPAQWVILYIFLLDADSLLSGRYVYPNA